MNRIRQKMNVVILASIGCNYPINKLIINIDAKTSNVASLAEAVNALQNNLLKVNELATA